MDHRATIKRQRCGALSAAVLATATLLFVAPASDAQIMPSAAPARTVKATSGIATHIVNTAQLDYTDASGAAYRTYSNTVTYVQVAAMVVTPKETAPDAAVDGYIAGQQTNVGFTIANAGNAADAYTITNCTASAGRITGVAFAPPSSPATAVTFGATKSPPLAIGTSLPFVVSLDTTGVGVNSAIKVTCTVQSAGNAGISDTGTRFALANGTPKLTGPGGNPIAKLVDGVHSERVSPGKTVTFSIPFSNAGDGATTNLVLTDPLPAGLAPVLESVKVNGAKPPAAASVASNTLTIPLPSLAPGGADSVTFDATVDASVPSGTTLVNVASLAADGIAPIKTQPASVLVGGTVSEGSAPRTAIVFDGYGGSGSPVGNAALTLVDATNHALALDGSAVAPNDKNVDPFATGADGRYAFGLGSDQYGSTSGRASYLMTIVASGYLNRKIRVDLQPSALYPTLYDATLTALDGQSLAAAGGYTLTDGPVTVHNVFGFFTNLPVFAPSSVTLTKTADRQSASAGDSVMWTIAYANASKASLATALLVDTMPPGLAYASGTAKIDGRHAEPDSIAQGVLTWKYPSFAAGETHTLTYASVVSPSAPDAATLVNSVTFRGSVAGGTVSATATASVDVTAGAFTTASIITGRVFASKTKSEHFAKGDSGIPGVRIYLEDGESALTDRDGRYTFPGVRPGIHVLRLDPTTFPSGVRPLMREGGVESQTSTQRLVHGIFNAGTLRDVNFALEGGQ